MFYKNKEHIKQVTLSEESPYLAELKKFKQKYSVYVNTVVKYDMTHAFLILYLLRSLIYYELHFSLKTYT